MNAALMGPNLQLPWAHSRELDGRFRKMLQSALVALCVLGAIIPLAPVPEIEREELEQLPPQLARVVLEQKPLPKPVIKPKPKPVVKAKPKPKPKKPQPVKPDPKPVQTVNQAKKVASSAGLLQFQDDLAAMRDNLDTAQLHKNNLSKGAAQAHKVERSIITSQATGKSGGINTAALSQDTGGTALSGRETTKVSGPVDSNASSSNRVSRNTKGAPGRSEQDIRRVMDSNKGGIFAIYNRALRKNPALEGKFVVRMVIEPSGQVSNIKLISSELQDPGLEAKLLSRIKLIIFGAENVARTTLNYSFDFLPY